MRRKPVTGVTVTLHPAESCINDLQYTGGPWWGPQRFDVVKKWMQEYYWRVKRGQLPEPLEPALGGPGEPEGSEIRDREAEEHEGHGRSMPGEEGDRGVQ